MIFWEMFLVCWSCIEIIYPYTVRFSKKDFKMQDYDINSGTGSDITCIPDTVGLSVHTWTWPFISETDGVMVRGQVALVTGQR
jgi:hypothetical protein